MAHPLSAYTLPRHRPRSPRQAQPDTVRLYYLSALRSFLAKVHALIAQEVVPVLLEIAPEPLRADADDESKVKAALDRVAEKLNKDLPASRFLTLSREVARRTDEFQKQQLFQQVKAAIGLDPLINDKGLEQKARDFVKENAALIKTVPTEYLADIEKRALDGVRAGQRASDIAAGLEERYGVAESRAQLIANTQVGAFFGEVNDLRLRNLGVTQAIWRTVKDNRVRDSHAHLDGRTYDLGVGLYDEQLGETILPGQALNCRCDNDPDFTTLLG